MAIPDPTTEGCSAMRAGAASQKSAPGVAAALLFLLGVLFFFRHTPSALRWPLRILSAAALVWLVIAAVRAARTTRFTMKKTVFSLILGLCLYLALSLICHLFLKLMAARDDRAATHAITSLDDIARSNIAIMLNGTSFKMFDPDVGWVPRPGTHPDGTINQQGVRARREYAFPAPDPAKRVLCLGDSYTFGDEVGDTESYPAQAEQLRPGTEWINLGISSTCLAQSLVHYRKNAKKFGGKHVVIGFMTDDAKRTVNCCRLFLTPFNPYTKPFAKFTNGVFSLERNPFRDLADYQRLLDHEKSEIARLMKMDYLTWSNQRPTSNPILRTVEYAAEALEVEKNVEVLLSQKPQRSRGKGAAGGWTGRWPPIDPAMDPYGKAIWNPNSLGFNAITRLFDLCYSEIVGDGREPLIVIIPGPFDVENERSHHPRIYDALLDHFKAKRYHYLDFLDSLVARHKDDLTFEALYGHCHFRASTYKELAEEIVSELHL